MYLVDEFFIFSPLVLLKEMRTWVSPRFHLVVFMFGVNQNYLEVKGVQDFFVYLKWWKASLSYNKLLERVAFRILSNMNDGALL